MNNELMSRIKHKSMRSRLIIPTLLAFMVIIVIDLVMFTRLNSMVGSLDNIYSTNEELGQLEGRLTAVQEDLNAYLNSQSDEAFDEFTVEMKGYTDTIKGISDEISDNPARVLERDIRKLSESYIKYANNAVEIKKNNYGTVYRNEYKKASEIYKFLILNIQSLDAMRFEVNSENYGVLYSSLLLLEKFILCMLVFAAVYMTVILYMIIGTITKPLTKLSVLAKEVQNGNLDLTIEDPKYDDEVGTLTITFRAMLSSIKENISKIKEASQREIEMKEKELKIENLLKDAQLKYYQAQINPHFLFNTLNAGQQLAMMESAERTYLFLYSTASFFRGQLRGNGSESTLRQELELVDNYIYIMNVRYSGEIHVSKEINEKMLDIRFPGMVLQPVVENALRYAFTDPEQDKNILIRITKERKDCIIEIIDNGCGISRDVLEAIRNDTLESAESGTGNGVGLKNVKERLQLSYNRKNVFYIDSECEGEDHGTKVTLRIPVDGPVEKTNV